MIAADQLSSLLAQSELNGNILGFRCLPAGDPVFAVGEEMDCSGDWQDDELVGELPGACAISAECGWDTVVRMLELYHGTTSAIYLVSGDGNSIRGQDLNEVILSNPTVISRIR